MTGRIPCVVPFCGRTTSAEKLSAKGHDQWLCADHWRLVDPRIKRLKARAERKLRKGIGTPAVLQGIAYRTWEKAKRQAIEAAGGIA